MQLKVNANEVGMQSTKTSKQPAGLFALANHLSLLQLANTLRFMASYNLLLVSARNLSMH